MFQSLYTKKKNCRISYHGSYKNVGKEIKLFHFQKFILARYVCGFNSILFQCMNYENEYI